MSQQIKLRNQIDPKWQWKLENLYTSQEQWEGDYELLKHKVTLFIAYEKNQEESLNQVVKDFFETQAILIRLYAYAKMNLDSDNSNDASLSLFERVTSLAVSIETATSFLVPRLLNLPEDQLKNMINDFEMIDYNVFLQNILREKPHILTAEQERLLAMAGEIIRAPENAYNMLTNVDMSFPDVVDDNDISIPLTESTYQSLKRSKVRSVRKLAFNSIHETYGSFNSTLASLYASNVKSDVFLAKTRNFSSSLEAALFPNQIPISVYDNLLRSVHSSLPWLDQYLNVMTKSLNLDKLHMYDLYAPAVENFDINLPFSESYDLVLEGLKPLGDEYISVLERARSEGWIDVYPNKAKTSGAYSFGVYGSNPFILLNHQDNLDSTMTLAHELGHSVHSYYSNKKQPYPKADYSIFVAEVASTCNEIIMIRHLLKKYENNLFATSYFYNYFLEQFRTTVFRQTMFAEFEQITHQMAEKNEPLTKETLNEVYYTLNQRYYGKNCHVDDLISYEWMRIPHFYRSFYVYQYATGFSAAVNLADNILNNTSGALEGYIDFLSSGGSLPPIEALKLAGIDMSTTKPVDHAMSIFRSTVDAFIRIQDTILDK